MVNQSLRGKLSGAGMSCDGKRYTMPLKTLAVGSALNWSRITGFCELANVLINAITAGKNSLEYFIFVCRYMSLLF
jgi:hypothetical protein